MPTYAYATERRDELLELAAPVPPDWAGRYVDPPELRRLPLDARAGLRTVDDLLTEGDTLLLFDLADVWATLKQAIKQLKLWHERGVTVKLLGLNVTLGQNTPELLRLLKGSQWKPPKPPPGKTRPIPEKVHLYVGYGWKVRRVRTGLWHVQPDESARELQGSIIEMQAGGMRDSAIAEALNVARMYARRCAVNKKCQRLGFKLSKIVRWTTAQVCRAVEKERELREFEDAYASGSLPAGEWKVATVRGWTRPPEAAHQRILFIAERNTERRRRGRSRQRDAAMAQAAGPARDSETPAGDDGADRARGSVEP